MEAALEREHAAQREAAADLAALARGHFLEAQLAGVAEDGQARWPGALLRHHNRPSREPVEGVEAEAAVEQKRNRR